MRWEEKKEKEVEMKEKRGVLGTGQATSDRGGGDGPRRQSEPQPTSLAAAEPQGCLQTRLPIFQTLPLQNTPNVCLASLPIRSAPVSYLLLLLLKYSLCCEHKEWERFVLFIGSSGMYMHHPTH